MNTFNYREYLAYHNWTGNPFGGIIDTINFFNPPNPFFLEWGPFQYFKGVLNYFFDDERMRDSLFRLERESYCYERVSNFWNFIKDRVNSYAASHGKSIYLSFNGSAGIPTFYADYRLNPLGKNRGLFPTYPSPDPIDTLMTHLDGFQAQVNLWRLKREWAMSEGDSVPLVVFLDFGHMGFPFSHLGGSAEFGYPADERAEYLRSYPFEIYASGAKFCFPVREPHFHAFRDTLSDGTPLIEIIKNSTKFLNTYHKIYKNVKINPLENGVEINGIIPFNGEWNFLNGRLYSPVNESKVTISYMDSEVEPESYLHIINHNWDSLTHHFIPQIDLWVVVPFKLDINQVLLISPDFPDTIELPFVISPSKIRFRVPELKYYCVVILKHPNFTKNAIDNTKLCFLKLAPSNIFSEELSISYKLSMKQRVMFSFYNVLGQCVRVIREKTQPPGSYQIIWDGKDMRGRLFSPGIYFLELKTNEFKLSKKLIKLR